MAQKIKWNEAVGGAVVVLVLVGLPLLLHYWRHEALARRYPTGTKIINLTAIARGGLWTQEEIAGVNYWWKKPTRASEIALNKGDHVVVRLHSVDVLHSFAIPLLRLGPVDVPAGHTVEMKFDAGRGGVLTFLCWQVCSPDHPGLRGRFLVKGGESDESW